MVSETYGIGFVSETYPIDVVTETYIFVRRSRNGSVLEPKSLTMVVLGALEQEQGLLVVVEGV